MNAPIYLMYLNWARRIYFLPYFELMGFDLTMGQLPICLWHCRIPYKNCTMARDTINIIILQRDWDYRARRHLHWLWPHYKILKSNVSRQKSSISGKDYRYTFCENKLGGASINYARLFWGFLTCYVIVLRGVLLYIETSRAPFTSSFYRPSLK